MVGGVDDPMLEDNVKEEGRWKMIGILVVEDMADCLVENGLGVVEMTFHQAE